MSKNEEWWHKQFKARTGYDVGAVTIKNVVHGSIETTVDYTTRDDLANRRVFLRRAWNEELGLSGKVA